MKTCHGIALSLFLLASSFICAQDSPSLGDLARQQRQQKEHSKAATDKNAKPPKVITNEEIPEHASIASASQHLSEDSAEPRDAANAGKLPAEQWRSQILSQKGQIANLQHQIEDLNESIRFAPANCVSNCVEWNERQREKQQQVERMQAQLDEQKKRLDETQESARKQGYGSSVYDP
ncbi:MAG: hypothetical protein ABR874_15870 [Candidatus Sulfotelmatobacter sp.]|jgi:hypothetical protein